MDGQDKSGGAKTEMRTLQMGEPLILRGQRIRPVAVLGDRVLLIKIDPVNGGVRVDGMWVPIAALALLMAEAEREGAAEADPGAVLAPGGGAVC